MNFFFTTGNLEININKYVAGSPSSDINQLQYTEFADATCPTSGKILTTSGSNNYCGMYLLFCHWTMENLKVYHLCLYLKWLYHPLRKDVETLWKKVSQL